MTALRDIKALEDRAHEAEIRIVSLEAKLAGLGLGAGVNGERYIQELQALRSVLLKAKAEQEKLEQRVTELEGANSKLAYQVKHLKRAVQENDQKIAQLTTTTISPSSRDKSSVDGEKIRTLDAAFGQCMFLASRTLLAGRCEASSYTDKKVTTLMSSATKGTTAESLCYTVFIGLHRDPGALYKRNPLVAADVLRASFELCRDEKFPRLAVLTGESVDIYDEWTIAAIRRRLCKHNIANEITPTGCDIRTTSGLCFGGCFKHALREGLCGFLQLRAKNGEIDRSYRVHRFETPRQDEEAALLALEASRDKRVEDQDVFNSWMDLWNRVLH